MFYSVRAVGKKSLTQFLFFQSFNLTLTDTNDELASKEVPNDKYFTNDTTNRESSNDRVTKAALKPLVSVCRNNVHS